MRAALITGWILAGVGGGYLLWLDTVCRSWHDWPAPRPSPATILGLLACSLFGPILLFVGLTITYTRWSITAQKDGNWFFRPIGGGKR